MSERLGATSEDWRHFSKVLGLTECLLPTVCNKSAKPSPYTVLTDPGKVPSEYNDDRQFRGFKQWAEHVATDDQVARWSAEPDYGICVVTRGVVGIDVDIDAAAAAEPIIRLVEGILGPLPKRGRQGSARVLMPVRLAGFGGKKRILLPWGAVEFLADGNQFVAAGTHVKSGRRYEWVGGLPAHIPEVRAEAMQALLDYLGRMGSVQTDSKSSLVRGERVQADDPVADFLHDNNLVLREMSDGKLVVECPWSADHSTDTTGSDTTIYYPAGVGGVLSRGFKCLHAHCADRTARDFRNAIGYEEPAANVDEVFEELEHVDQDTGEITTRLAPVGVALQAAVASAGDDEALQAVVRRIGVAGLDDLKTDMLLRAVTARYRALALPVPGLPVLRKVAGRARAALREVPAGITIVDPGEVAKTADTVAAAMTPGGELVRWKAANYRYVGGRFEEVSDPLLLPSAVLRVLSDYYQPGKDGGPPARLMPSATYAREIANEMMARAAFDAADLPVWRSGSWAASDTVSMANGLLHIPTRNLVAHTPAFVSTGQLTFGYDAAARCPAWESFVHSALDGDGASIDLLQEMFGYLLGGSNDRHAIFYLLGVPGSGKSTVGSVLAALMAGDCAATSIETLGTDFGLQNLLGRRVAIMGDQNEEPGRSARLALARLKAISGGDAVDVNRKGLPMITAVLPTRFVIISNDLVRLPDSSGALKRRYFLIRFRKGYEYRKARGEEADTGLTARLLGELPGIFNWALAGWSRLNARGTFVQPDTSQDVLTEMHQANDPLGAFLEECVEFGQFETPSSEIYEAYRRHHAATGGDSTEIAKNVLIRKINMKHADRVHVIVKKIDGRAVKVCVGLKIKSEWSDSF